MNSAWPPAERPVEESVRGRQAVIEAAADHDVDVVVRALDDPDDRVRETAVVAAHELDVLDAAALAGASADPSMRVRRAVAKSGATSLRVDLATLVEDTDPTVCETACWAAGERGADAAPLVAVVAAVATDHVDALCREAAVAALGAIGDDMGLPAILAATNDRATVRRRAILALAPFDTPEVAAALQRALEDRDWQVRQAAEDLLEF